MFIGLVLKELQQSWECLGSEKIEGSILQCTVWGIELDTVVQTTCLREIKLVDLYERMASFGTKREVTLTELQHLVGHLDFMCNVVAPEQAFLHQLCEATKDVRLSLHRVQITKGMWVNLLVRQIF